MSEMPEDMQHELQEALDDQLALWGDGDERALHEVNGRLLDVLRRARAFEAAMSDGVPAETQPQTPLGALRAAIQEQNEAYESGDQDRLGRANKALADAVRDYERSQEPESQ